MITFKQFLAEDEEHTLDEAVQIFKDHCSDWRIAAPLFRISGTKRDPAKPISSRSTRVRQKRSVADTADFQEWAFSLPEWHGFPDRSRSVFCSTTRDFEVGSPTFKHMYCIYPYNGIPLAVTEASDFNLSRIPGLGDFMDINWNMLEDIDDLADDEDERNEREKESLSTGPLRDRWQAACEISDDFAETFADIEKKLTPEKLGVHLEHAKTISKHDLGTHEVWFEGKYLLIPSDQLDEFVKKVGE